MIVTQNEIDELARAVDEYYEGSAFSRALAAAAAETHPLCLPSTLAIVAWSKLTAKQRMCIADPCVDSKIFAHLRNHPQLLIPSGFDEIRIEPDPARQLANKMHEKLGHIGAQFGSFQPDRLASHGALEFRLGIHCRDAATGSWYRTAYIEHGTGQLCLPAATGSNVRAISFQDVLENCKRAATQAQHPAVLLLPNLWHDPSLTSHVQISEASRELVLALQRQNISLEDITWWQLEDVVTEVLRHKGFQIQATPRSRDGGRDIIARGEMVPGETCIVAVEVKHRPVVKISEIRSHLQANKDFPMLLVATSGKFSAAVVREKLRPENFLRLHLRDRQSLSAWISEYC